MLIAVLMKKCKNDQSFICMSWKYMSVTDGTVCV